MFFTARFTQDAEFAETKYLFFSGERPEKKRSDSVMVVRIIAGHRNNTIVNKMAVSGSACSYLFSFVLQVPLFSAGSKENKSNSKLCVLYVSAVNIVLTKTLSKRYEVP